MAEPFALTAAFFDTPVPETAREALAMIDRGEKIGVPNWALIGWDGHGAERVNTFFASIRSALEMSDSQLMSAIKDLSSWAVQVGESRLRLVSATALARHMVPGLTSEFAPELLSAADVRAKAANYDGADWLETNIYGLMAVHQGYRKTVDAISRAMKSDPKITGGREDWIPLMVVWLPDRVGEADHVKRRAG